MKIAFLGLGVMGYPMAGHLKQAGHAVTVFNRTQAKAEAWAQDYGGDFAPTIAEACTDANLVFACVGNDRDIEVVATQAFAAMATGGLFVDHTTASATMARQLAETAQAQGRGLGFIDAPVSGGQAGAENGQLTIMCGAAQTDFDRAAPIMQAYAKYCGLIGPVGAGQLTKMVNQIAIAGLVQGLAEALDFGIRADLDMEKVLAAISGGAAGSWQMSNRGSTMVADQFDFGFAVDWMRKDLGMALDEGERMGAKLDITRLVDQFYAEVQDMGGGRWDTSSLIRRYRDAHLAKD